IMGDAAKNNSVAMAAVGKVNRDALEALTNLLPTEAAFSFRNDFNRQAYPDIYNDQLSIEKHLRDALKMADLTDDQKRKLGELAAEYQPAYANFCDQMVSFTTNLGPVDYSFGFDAEAIKKMQEREEAMSKFRF